MKKGRAFGPTPPFLSSSVCQSVAALAAILAPLAPCLERLAPLGDGDGPVPVAVLAIETGQRPLEELLAGDETLLAEQPAGADRMGPMRAPGEPATAVVAALGPTFASLLADLLACLLELGAGHASTTVEIEPIEDASGALLGTLLP